MEGRATSEPVAATRIDHRHRRRLRRAHASSGAPSGRPARLQRALQDPRHRPRRASERGWRVECSDLDSGEMRSVTAQIRLHRRRRRRAAAAAEIRHPGRARLWRLSRSAGSGCAATTPTINKRHHAKVYGKAAVGLAADVGAASRYARHRRPALAAVRSLCRFLRASFSSTARCSTSSSRSGRTTSSRCCRWRATISTSPNI